MTETPIKAATKPPRGESQQNVSYMINFVHKYNVATSFSVFSYLCSLNTQASFHSGISFSLYFARSTNQGS